MSIMTVTSTVTHKSLMNKSKSDIAYLYLELCDVNGRLNRWVDDLQSGMYVNCVYCGHRYGPADKVPVSMAEVLKQHVEQCPEHPMSKLRTALKELVRQVEISNAVDDHGHLLKNLKALADAKELLNEPAERA